MKKTCIICGKRKGTRTCGLHQNATICPVCCATIREQSCEGCRYYTMAQQHQASKAHHVGSTHVVAEMNEDVDKAVEHALALCEKRSFRKAHVILQELVPDHPRHPHVYFGMGVYHALQGHDDDALRYFDQATDIFPYFVDAYFNKGVIYKKKQDIKHMLNAFQMVIDIGDPHDEYVQQTHNILQQFEQHLREHDHITLEAYVKGMEMFDRAFEAMNDLKWEQAIRHFQKCLRFHPHHPQSYGNMGICYGKLGHKVQALHAFDMALELDPQYEPAIVNRAIVESLQEGEKLPPDTVETIEYYKEYPRKKTSYIHTLVQQLKKVLPFS